MRILILNWRDPKNPKAGGAEIVTLEHAKAWVKEGHNVTWLSSFYENALKEEVIEGVKIIRKGSSIGVYLIAPFYYLKNKETFDFVIDEIHGIPFFTPLYVKKKKIIFIHEVAGEIWDYMYPFPLNKIGRAFEKIYFKLYKNEYFWTDAQSTIDELVQFGIKSNNCIAIPCPANNKPLNKIFKKGNEPVFIFVSRLVKMKGIEDVISAFSYILKKNSKAKLWLVGGGEISYLNELKKITKNMHIDKNVIFYGRVSDNQKLELLKRAHILLHASVKEGWGIVVVEAASQSTPSVVYNVEGLRDVVKNNKTGIVIANNTPEDLAKEALLLYKNKVKYYKMQNNCLEYANHLQWKEVVKESSRLIKSL